MYLAMQMGQQIKKAREELGMSQDELAQSIYKRRATVSDLENGKSLPSLETLTYLALSLKKPLLYFVGEKYQPMLRQHENLTVEEKELLIQFRRLSENHQKIALDKYGQWQILIPSQRKARDPFSGMRRSLFPTLSVHGFSSELTQKGYAFSLRIRRMF